jgi:hypothetical protein
VGRPRRSRAGSTRTSTAGGTTGALAGAGFFFQDEITTWVKSKQAKPIEFEAGRAFEPGADTARVYALLPTEPPLLVTNADRKDVFAGVWDPRAGKRAYALKSGPTIPTAVLDPKVTQFRFHNDRLAVFNRDPQVTDRGGIWVYTLPPVRDDPPANGGKSGPPAADREVAAAELGARKRTWDVNRDLTRAVSPPNGGKATLWSPATGSTVAELSADGTAFRALAFSPDGQYLVGLCDQSWVWVWDASTGKLDTGRKTRLAARPAWDGNELGAMTFDPGFTRLVITTDSKTGSWDVKTGAAADPVKRLTDGELLNMNYRLRCETGGTGTFSVFRDDFPLRACQLKAFEGAGVTTWCLSTDRALLAAASNRKVQTWRLKYPDK